MLELSAEKTRVVCKLIDSDFFMCKALDELSVFIR